MGKTIGIISLKGGVGKTSSVVSLGDAISSFDKKVLLVDANFSAPNLGLHLDILEPEITLHNVLNRTANIKDAIYNLENFDVIPSSVFTNIKINPFELRDKLRHLKRNYDVIIIDSSPALNEETLAVMLASDEILVVTTPDYPTLSTTLKAVKLAKQRGTQIMGLIINKVHNKNFELSLDYIEDTIKVPVMAVIPHDLDFLKALSEFTPLTSYKPNSKSSIEYKKLAGILIGEKYKIKRDWRKFFRITPRKEEVNREIFYDSYFK